MNDLITIAIVFSLMFMYTWFRMAGKLDVLGYYVIKITLGTFVLAPVYILVKGLYDATA